MGLPREFEMLKAIFDALFSISLLSGSIYLWFVADAFPRFQKYRNVDSEFWPKILLIAIIILAVCLLFQNIAALKRQIRKKVQNSGVVEKKEDINWKMFFAMSLICLMYFWGLQLMGFIVSTVLFLFAATALIGINSRLTRFLFPFVFTFALAIMFVKILDLSLPRGVWLFREFSLLFY